MFAPGYYRNGIVRLFSPYMGETFQTQAEAEQYVKEEELDKYCYVQYFELVVVSKVK